LLFGIILNKQHFIEISLLPNDYIKYKFFSEKLKADKKVMEDKKIEMKIMPELSSNKENVVYNLIFQRHFIKEILKNENHFWKVLVKSINIIPWN
jgi:hypothetical protein